MSFYRTYRPQTIADIDNESVRSHLTSLLSKGRDQLPHAFLFTGPKGAGKTTAARIIAKLFNCIKYSDKGPCGKCEQCTAIATGKSLDVIEMDAASNRGIDEIRQLRDRIGLAPATATHTIYIIDEVHMLTTEAFNALLKTLEEPPRHAVFILATTDRQKVPDTIQSRCITIVFTRAAADELMHALSRIAKAEHIDIEKVALETIAHAADGSFRDAVKYLEQVSFTATKITAEVVEKTLALPDEKMRQVFLGHLAEKDVRAALADIQGAVSDGRDMKAFIVGVVGDLEAMLVASATGKRADSWKTAALLDAIRRFVRAFAELKSSPVPQLPVELAVIEFCSGEVVQESSVSGQKLSGKKAPASDTDVPQKPENPSAVSAVQDSGAKQPVRDTTPAAKGSELLTLPKLRQHWQDFIAATRPFNHSVAGVLRSSRPKGVDNGIVTIEAFYSFHRDKLNEIKTRQILEEVLKKLFGAKVKVEIVLGKK